MTNKQAHDLGQYVRSKRAAEGLSARAVADYAGIDAAQVLRIERGEVAAPQAAVLGRIAERLQVPIDDILVLAGYPTSRSLPTIEPYLRAKYPHLKPLEVERITTLIHELDNSKPPKGGKHE